MDSTWAKDKVMASLSSVFKKHGKVVVLHRRSPFRMIRRGRVSRVKRQPVCFGCGFSSVCSISSVRNISSGSILPLLFQSIMAPVLPAVFSG